MSRETILDDAISNAKADEDWQLVEWLRMARGAESASRWYSDKLRESHRATRKLQDENRKLRGLVRDMWPHVRHRSATCRECELPCDTADECLLYEPMRQRMAELGIEVSE